MFRIPLRFSMAGLLLALLIPFWNASARAVNGTTIFVTTTQDELNQDGDCSLREAVRSANLNTSVDACAAGNGTDVIVLEEGLYPLSIPGIGEDDAASGDLDLREGVTIQGRDWASTIIDGNRLDRVFHVLISSSFRLQEGSNPSARPVKRAPISTLENVVRLTNLTIRNGHAPGGEAEYFGGGGILNLGSTLEIREAAITGNQAARTGGGIDNVASTALLQHVLISGNSAENGGGIFNDGTLNLNQVTLDGNTALDRGGGLDTQMDATLINVTISGNTAGQMGGGVNNDELVMFLNSTVVNNNTGVANRNGVRFKSTIVANNPEGDCIDIGAFTTDGNNLDSDGTCKFNHPADQSAVQPMLGPLQDNGGEFKTHALLPGSPAIDRANNLDCPPTDGRGAMRPADGNGDDLSACDIGAFEYNGVFMTGLLLPMLNP
jgi:CSLREA domain-containing protein